MRRDNLYPISQPLERRQCRRRATDHPDLCLLRLEQVLTISGLARSSLYEAMRDRVFPQPVHPYQRNIRWVNLEVRDWLAERLDARRRR